MFYAILALVEGGDEAIYPDPGFPIYSSMINFPSSSSRSSPDRKSTDSTECQAIAMSETGLLDGPLVDAAHERCMAARGYRKK